MNYILFHIGEIPKHLSICLNNILSVDKNSKVYFLTDRKFKLPGIQTINIYEHEYMIDKTNQIKEIYFGTNFENNPLWFTSLLRIYAVKYFSEILNIKEFIHFDNDVLIYESFEEIFHDTEVFKNNQINITQLDNSNISFGYCYIPNKELLDHLIKFIEIILTDYKKYFKEISRGDPFNEMQILKRAFDENSSNYNLLPILPYSSKKYLFDPASYGQFLDGGHLNRGNFLIRRRYISMKHIVGRELMSNRINIKFKDKPVVYFKKNEYKLVNLHVHSKNLYKFVPKEFKIYLNDYLF